VLLKLNDVLFFLGYTILAALLCVACFLLVKMCGNIFGKQLQIAPEINSQYCCFARERKSFFVVVIQRFLTHRSEGD
jgi:hypothetical protein